MCDFWVNLDNFFAVIYTGFHEGYEDFFFAPIEVIKKIVTCDPTPDLYGAANYIKTIFLKKNKIY